MRILITGANGFIGNNILIKLKSNKSNEIQGIDINQTDNIQSIDVSNRNFFSRYLSNYKPDFIIHTAAIKDLIKCENNKLNALKTNTLSTETIAEYVKNYNSDAKVVYISSDVVFDGIKGNYEITDNPNPINWYGKTKLFSEIILKNLKNYSILRTALVIGNLNEANTSALKKELNNSILQNQTLLPQYVFGRLEKGLDLRLPTNIISNPTHVNEIVKAIEILITTFKIGVFHLAGTTQISRYDFAKVIADKFDLNQALIKIDNTKVVPFRPRNISLNTDKSMKILGLPLDEWTIDNYLKQIDFTKI
jgi:dTDP-4-dehydrorhamnose reductase